MEPIAAILFMVSCNPNMIVCREQPAPTAAYDNLGECEVAKTVVTRHVERDGKVTVATCVAVDEDLLESDAEIIWYVNRVGDLKVEISPTSPDVDQIADASNVVG